MDQAKFTGSITCMHCGNKAPMKIVAKHSKITANYDEASSFSWDEGFFWELIECPACSDILLRKGYWHEYQSEESGPDFSLLYPGEKGNIAGLPYNISKAYSAALKVKSVDSNAFGVLLGRVLDLVYIDQKAKGNTLFERLKDLAQRGIMPERLAVMAHGIRQLRNIGAHADLGELTAAEVPILESLIRAILEYVYAAPAMVAFVQRKIDALITKKPSKGVHPARRHST